MKIIKQGVLPENRAMVGVCDKCGCVVECAKHEAPYDLVRCPTEGCDQRIDVKDKDDD